jgi:hypothetical protein
MSGPKPTYFIPANFDNPYPGPLKLGQLISDLKYPRKSLDSTGPEDLKANKVKIWKNKQKVVVHQQEEKTEKEVGLFIKALDVVGAAFQANFDQHSLNSLLSNIETLDVEFIVPTDEYVLESMKKPQVQT